MNERTASPVDVLLAGGTGALGGRIARELRKRDARVTAIVRRETAAERTRRLESIGVSLVELDFGSLAELTAACMGAACVVSALNGLDDIILGNQTTLLEAAVAAGVPRFIPSDFPSTLRRHARARTVIWTCAANSIADSTTRPSKAPRS